LRRRVLGKVVIGAYLRLGKRYDPVVIDHHLQSHIAVGRLLDEESIEYRVMTAVKFYFRQLESKYKYEIRQM
jgi:hypothetical protein